MRDAKQNGLDHMPKVDEFIAELMLFPDEALKDDVRCPTPQCRAGPSESGKVHVCQASLCHISMMPGFWAVGSKAV